MVDEQNRFITDASHELRTPLTSLRTEIEVGLRDKTIDLNSAKKLLESNLEEVIALQSLSDNLLELAQNGKEIKNTEKKELSILEIVNKAIKKVEPLALNKGVKIEKKIKDEKIFVVPDRISEVFVILLDNAIKYSKNKTKIIIESKKEKEKISISVTDYGIGIAKDDVPHIFDRFYRANKSRSKTETPGYGLGLSIAKKIIKAHDGEISVSSVFSKKTTFTVSIPI
jgi:signal transduction histidine kinase